MRFKVGFALVVLAAIVCGRALAEDHERHVKTLSKSASFEKFKQLEGTWVGSEKGKPGLEVVVSYKVTAAGSAVVETIFPGGEHEMISVIHPDGDDLLLTHYCMLGNQPQMKAAKSSGDKVDFKFVRATNLSSDKDMHMHNASFTFVDKDTLKSEWTNYTDGKAAGDVVFELKRKK